MTFAGRRLGRAAPVVGLAILGGVCLVRARNEPFQLQHNKDSLNAVGAAFVVSCAVAFSRRARSAPPRLGVATAAVLGSACAVFALVLVRANLNDGVRYPSGVFQPFPGDAWWMRLAAAVVFAVLAGWIARIAGTRVTPAVAPGSVDEDAGGEGPAPFASMLRGFTGSALLAVGCLVVLLSGAEPAAGQGRSLAIGLAALLAAFVTWAFRPRPQVRGWRVAALWLFAVGAALTGLRIGIDPRGQYASGPTSLQWLREGTGSALVLTGAWLIGWVGCWPARALRLSPP